ncbi:MAG TPA: nuclear transport factor 2 family protein [Vicinamibacterales bacterium]|nr:nuclear transport factor 2 family protein [Vicinamibacterales bacterium]
MSNLPNGDAEAILAAEDRIFAAIRARDSAALAAELATDFVHSALGQPDQGRDAFLKAIGEMPYRILEIAGQDLRVRVMGDVAVLSGVQRARVALPDGSEVVAATAFVDLFARLTSGWRLRHAVSAELPEAPAP